jgi:DNA adenine methylase
MTKNLETEVVNVASVPKRSPFRYPGGKTWLVPEIRRWLKALFPRTTTLVEPFAGGGIVSLTAVFEGLVDGAVMCERDEHVAALWRLILSEPEWLTDQILSFEVSRKNVDEIISGTAPSLREQGFRTLVLNRVQRGGILAKGASLLKKGENGKGLASRWYAKTLAHRIWDIWYRRNRITFIEADGLEVLRHYSDSPTCVFFVDPPYTAGGKRAGARLYTHNEIDHLELFRLLGEIKGHFLATYDDAPEVLKMAEDRGFHVRRIPMKNTHHARQFELLITP